MSEGRRVQNDVRYQVLFVCTGNICRSPYAEAVAAASGLAGAAFASAGTRAVRGAGIDPPMEALLPEGVDASKHQARQITRDIAQRADLIVALAAEHRRWLLDSWPECGQKTFVIGQMAREFAALPQGMALADVPNQLRRRRTAVAGDDVPDPYRRGPAAAQEAASRIDESVAALVQGLSALLK